MKPNLIVVFGGMITLLGALISLYGTYRTSEQQADEAKKLAEAQGEGFRQITGGDSFCYLKLLVHGATEAELVVLHVGKYPISDVSLRFVDSDQLAGPPPPGVSPMDYLLSAEVDIPVGTLPIKGFRRVGRIQIPGGAVEKKYLAAFAARNGSWDESIVLRKTAAGDWRVALKINENPGQVKFAELNKPLKLLFHEIAPDFPVQSDHEIHDWLAGQSETIGKEP